MEQWKEQYIPPLPTSDQVQANASIYELGQSQEFFQFYCGDGDWRPTHYYINEEKAIFNRPFINQELGDFLFSLVDRVHPKTDLKAKPDNLPLYLPLKISIIGGKFSGRRTLANYLQQKFGLEIIILDNIIKEALLEAFPPVEDEKDKKKKKDTKKVEEVKKANPEMKELGIKIKEIQDQGQPLPDQLMVEALLLKITQTFPAIDEKQLQQEIVQAKAKEQASLEEQQKQLEAQQQQQNKKIPPPTKKGGKVPVEVQQEGPTKEEIIKNYYNSKPYYYTKGFIILGFPETYQQAKMLEEAMTGYVPDEERLNEQAEKIKKKISELVSPPPIPAQTNFIESGLDLIICLDVSAEERVRRSTQRRIDPQTETIYNLEENPPPSDVKGLIEKLQSINDPNEKSEALIQKYQEFAQNLPALQDWSQQFGFKDLESGFSIFQIVQANTNKGYELAIQTDQYLSKIFDIKRAQYDALCQKLTEPTEPQDTQNIVLTNEPQLTPVKQNHNDDTQDQNERFNTSKNNDSYNHQLNQSYNINELDRSQCEIILKQWMFTQYNYTKEITGLLKKLQQNRKKIISSIIENQKVILEQLNRPDEKISKIITYQDSYNKFVEENPDLAKQKNAKEELGKHLQVLYEQLWDIIDGKRNESMQKLENLKQSNWLLQELNQFSNIVLMIYQTEANLLGEITEIILNAKVLLKGIQIQDLGEHFILEPFEQNQQVNVYDESTGQCPQMEDLFSYFVKSLDQICKMVTENKEKFISKRSTINLEAQHEFIDDLVNQITYSQKAIAIYRAHTIRNVTVGRIREMMIYQQLLYNRIDDWIIFGVKRENDYCYESFKFFEKCINDSTLALFSKNPPKEIQESFRLVLLQSIIYKPQLPWMEQLISDNFKLNKWYQWSEELRSIADERGQININIFDQYFSRRIKSDNCKSDIPKCLQHITGALLQKKFPASNNQQSFQLSPLLVSSLLLNSYLPSNEQLKAYIDELKQNDGEQQEEFCEIPAWFDEQETSQVLTDSEMQIDRVYYVKRLLYDALRSQDQFQINLNSFQNIMKSFDSQNGGTFRDFLQNL